MARETTTLLLGAFDRVVQPDALEGFTNSPEVGVEVRIRSKRYVLFAPAGEGVLKRIFLSVEHRAGVSLELIPIADGQRQFALRRFFSRAPKAGDPERASFLTPIGVIRDGGEFSTGLRGTTFGVQIVAVAPVAEFFLETVQFEANPLQAARGRREVEA